jgi:hypothetical protein
MEDKLRSKSHLMLKVKLTLLPRWVKHDFWRQCQPQNEYAINKLVDTIIATVDEEVDAAEKESRHN